MEGLRSVFYPEGPSRHTESQAGHRQSESTVCVHFIAFISVHGHNLDTK